jgi:hypothetical protein
VTSPLLNEILSVHKRKNQQRNQQQQAFHQLPKTSKLSVTTHLVTTLAILFGAEKYMMQPKVPKVPIITLLFSTSASLYFIYRHKVNIFVAASVYLLLRAYSELQLLLSIYND